MPFGLGLLDVALIAAAAGLVGLVVLDRFAPHPDFVIGGLYVSRGLVPVLGNLAGAFIGGDELSAPEIWIGRVSTLILLSVVALGLLRPRPRKAGRRLWLAGFTHYGIAFVAGYLTSGVVSEDNLRIALGFTAVWAATRVDPKVVARWAKWSLAAVMIASVLAAAAGAPEAWIPHGSGLIPGLNIRFQGILNHPNVLSPIPILYLLLERWQPSQVWVRRPLSLLAVVTLLLTQSKTAVVGAVIVALVVWAGSPERDRNARVGVGVAVLLLATGLVFFSEWGLEQLSDDVVDRTTTLTGRTALWEVGIQAWREEPILGAGPMFFVDYAERTDQHWAGQAHNQMIQTLAEQGLVGIITLALYVAALCRSAVRCSAVSRGTSLGIVALMLVRCLTETPLRSLSVEHLTMFCMLIAWERVAARRAATRPPQAARARPRSHADSSHRERSADAPQPA